MYKRIFPTGVLVLAAVVLLLGLAACDETAAANEYSQSLNNSERAAFAPEDDDIGWGNAVWRCFTIG
jgi:uncharacterized lipoprotein YehR (DUF1307 family)